MKILHVVPTYFPAVRYGGTIWSVHGLCAALASSGHEVHVWTTNVDGSRDLPVTLNQPVRLENVWVTYFRSWMPRRLYYSRDMASALKKMARFDIVHLHSIFLWPTWAAARAARKLGIPYVLSPRGMLVRELIERKNRMAKKAWISLIERKNLENAAAVHFTSLKEKEEAERFGFHFKKCLVIANGCGTEAFFNAQQQEESLSVFEAKKIAERGPFILFLGRINWKKGLDRLILSMAYVHGMNLVIAGHDEGHEQARLEALAQRSGLGGRVIFAGPAYGAAKETLFKSARIFALPSYSENFANSVLEAMASGCAVVLTPDVGLSDAVCEAGAGIVTAGDPPVFGKAMARLAAEPLLAEEMGQAGKRLVTERYLWGHIGKQFEKAYKEILCSGK